MTDELMLTAREVAKIIGVHVNTLKRIPPTRLPYYRIFSRGDRRYKPSDVATFLREARVDGF